MAWNLSKAVALAAICMPTAFIASTTPLSAQTEAPLGSKIPIPSQQRYLLPDYLLPMPRVQQSLPTRCVSLLDRDRSLNERLVYPQMIPPIIKRLLISQRGLPKIWKSRYESIPFARWLIQCALSKGLLRLATPLYDKPIDYKGDMKDQIRLVRNLTLPCTTSPIA